MGLSISQQEFFQLIERCSCSDVIMTYFDTGKKQLKIDLVNETMTQLSHGEQIMLKFFIMVWLHRNDFDFDFLEATQTLSLSNKEIVTSWFSEPIWP